MGHEGCMAAAMAVLGDKWNPFIIKSLAGGPTRFCKLQHDAGGINPRTLSNRLARLEKTGIITKRVISELPPHTEYQLTDKGRELLPIFSAMVAWSTRHPGEAADDARRRHNAGTLQTAGVAEPTQV